MSYSLQHRTVKKVGIVGSGQIGPDIALHMTKVLAPHQTPVIVVDIDENALAAGRAKLEKKIAKGVESRAFKEAQAAAMRANVYFTKDYEALRGADFIVEAASENLQVKRKIFAQLEVLCESDAILASNSSHLEPERIFEKLEDPCRGVILHYFFPAERNLLIEVVPGVCTDEREVRWLLDFFEDVGKVPIRVKSRYGYAIDPIFEGIFQAACLCVEEGLGTTREVDSVARRALGLGVGPFTAMNLTGGNPLTAHGLDEMHTRVNPWFRTPQLMKDAVASGRPWEAEKRGEKVAVEEARKETIARRMQGAYFGLVGEVYQSGIVEVADFDMGLEVGLVIKPAFRFMNEIGPRAALELVQEYQKVEPDFPVSQCLVDHAEKAEPWEVPVVLRRDEEGIAVLTIRRPLVLNALNLGVYDQLERRFQELAKDDSVRGVVITGFGKKAFVSGADVSMLAALESPEEGEETSRRSNEVLNRIDTFAKPVVCAYNGIAFGGGNELALACDARIARKGLAVLAGQPEPNLGIIPGSGGTQRLPRLIDFEKAWTMLRTGKPISGKEALECGLISEEVEGDLVKAAVKLANDLASGKKPMVSTPRGPIEVPKDLPDVDLGHLSTAVDAVMRKAILEGAKMPIEKGIEFESKCFGEVCALEDKKIGTKTFLEKGPRAKPDFVNR